jgi:hypothetical protein
MYVKIRGDRFTKNMLDEIAALTDTGKLRPADLRYDRDEHQVRVPLVRYPIKKAGRLRRYPYDAANPIECVAVIRHVTECTITDNTTGELQEITLLFGIGVQEKAVCISSAEEDHGMPCLLVEMNVNEINIELHDR